MITSDYHMHTEFSSDSEASMESMIQSAIALGLKDICITDHMDYNFPKHVPGPFIYDPAAHLECFKALADRYSSKIGLHLGIEMGLVQTGRDFYQGLLDTYPLDFNIASLHILDDDDPYFPEYWAKYSSEREVIEHYFTEMHRLITSFVSYDALGHLDYIFRYAPQQKQYEYSEYGDLIDVILKELIQNGRALEVNTAGYKYKLGHPNPQLSVLKRYRELGGELITVGSDAHRPEHIAYDFKSCGELLAQAGFRYIAIYKDHKPYPYSYL